jgi:hypothetical protein
MALDFTLKDAIPTIAAQFSRAFWPDAKNPRAAKTAPAAIRRAGKPRDPLTPPPPRTA